ncbi:hypothetical protein GCM10011504_51800 [Siccirubricoccus deserti]|nr:hypothetical protein GCM10011504_51800 [Siccirubricoccus deserti]
MVLHPRRWYAFQTIPGERPDSAFRPCTPAFITEVTPLKSGKGVLRLGFVAALCPVAAERRTLDLRVVLHRADYLIGTFLDAGGCERTAIFREVDLPWLAHYATEFWSRFPPSSLEHEGIGFAIETWDAQTYLNEAFGPDENHVLNGTTAASFGVKLHKMPKATAVIRLDRSFSEFDSYLIRRGVTPRQMEDRWFIYFESGRLLMRRSWTGLLIYEVVLEERGASLWARDARANRNPKQYGGTDDEDDKRMILNLIDELLLGLPARVPVQEGLLSPDWQAIAARSTASKAAFQ